MVFQPSSSVLNSSSFNIPSQPTENQNHSSQFDVVQSHYPREERGDTVERAVAYYIASIASVINDK